MSLPCRFNHPVDSLRSRPGCSRPARTLGRRLALLGLVVAVLGVTPAVRGADDWYVLGSWRTLAHGDDVRALARDGQFLWVATSGGGVVRWSLDGRWRQYLAPQDGLASNDVRDVVHWRGSWWFATAAGLALYDPRHDRMESVPADLPSPSVNALAVDAQDRLWVATGQWWNPAATFPGQEGAGGWVGGGVAYSEDGRTWHNLGAAGGLPSLEVRDILLWRGAIWVATVPYHHWQPPGQDGGGNPVPGRWQRIGGGVARYDGQRWQVYNRETQDELSDSARVLAGDERALWVGTGGRGLVVYDGLQWKALMDCGRPERCIQDNFVTALAVVPGGPVWVGTALFNGRGTGVGVLDVRGTPTDGQDDAWRVLGAADGLPGQLVHAILPDSDGTVWFGTADLDPNGRVYGAGLARLMADRVTFQVWRTATTGAGTPAGNDITALALHPLTGELWVGTARSGVSVLDSDGRWRHYTRASTGGGLASDHIAAIAIEPNGVVWVATRQATYDASRRMWLDGGLSRFDGQRWIRLAGPESGLPADHLSALALDGRGKLWVGTGDTDQGSSEHAYRGWGLAVVDTATMRWERTFTYPTLTSNNVTDIAVRGNEVWVATAYFFYVDPRPGGAQLSIGGGVSVYDLATGRWRRFTDADGLTVAAKGRKSASSPALLDMRSVYPAADGSVWVGGLSYPEEAYTADVAADGVIDVLAGSRVSHHRFTGAGATVELVSDGNGRLWALSALDGLRVRVDGQWLHLGAQRGGLPTSRLTTLVFGQAGAWVGTAGSGVLQLVPPAPQPQPTEPPAVVRRLPHKLYLPATERYVPSPLASSPILP